VGIGRFAYTPVLPAMQEATGFGAATAGWIAGWNYLGYLLGALGASLVAARGLRVEILMASVVASIVTTAAMGFTESISLWCALRFVSGLASAGVLVISAAIVLESLVRARRPHLMGVRGRRRAAPRRCPPTRSKRRRCSRRDSARPAGPRCRWRRGQCRR
jgi:MFS family permease